MKFPHCLTDSNRNGNQPIVTYFFTDIKRKSKKMQQPSLRITNVWEEMAAENQPLGPEETFFPQRVDC